LLVNYEHFAVQIFRKTSLYIRRRFPHGEIKRADAREEEDRRRDRFASTLVISASIIATVRLARDDINRPSPRLSSVIADSVTLPRMILEKVMR
jgi:hypothetical protein